MDLSLYLWGLLLTVLFAILEELEKSQAPYLIIFFIHMETADGKPLGDKDLVFQGHCETSEVQSVQNI